MPRKSFDCPGGWPHGGRLPRDVDEGLIDQIGV